MKIFPDLTTILPSYSIVQTERWKTNITDSDSGKEQRRQRWALPKRIVELPYNVIADNEADTLKNFFRSVRGAYEAFYIIIPHKRKFEDEYVSRGDGTTTIFELPSKETVQSTLRVYVNGTGTYVTFLRGGGVAGVDRIQFTTAPASGAMITADFEGKIRLKVRFGNDEDSEEWFSYSRYKKVIRLLEVR